MQPILFLSHGGGPLPLLNDPSHQPMIDSFEKIKQDLSKLDNKPSAIIMISAHWQANQFDVTAQQNPSLIYDYYGFPEASYHIQYRAPGAPELAKSIVSQLNSHQLASDLNQTRGFDHGMFVPLKLLYPQADFPVVQIALNLNDDPLQHLKVGEAINALREQNILIIGSGFSFHHIPAFFNDSYFGQLKQAEDFHQWLDNIIVNTPDYAEQQQQMENWKSVPGALFSHPTADHILPLHVCLGAAQKTADKTYEFKLNQWPARCYWWN